MKWKTEGVKTFLKNYFQKNEFDYKEDRKGFNLSLNHGELYIKPIDFDFPVADFAINIIKPRCQIVYSKSNGPVIDRYTQEFIDKMMPNSKEYGESDLKNISLKVTELDSVNYLKNKLKHLKIEFLAFETKGNTHVVSVDEIPDFFDVLAVCKKQKGESRSLKTKNITDLAYSLNKIGLDFEINDKVVQFNCKINDLKIEGKKYDYTIRLTDPENNIYKIRQHTKNCDYQVMFYLKFKKGITFAEQFLSSEFKKMK
ncbi:hypothetical protein [Mycoplasma sp. Ms02]|uniref:hypothetical protein n=1 Tax=Mycoplasma sp. Ms02 TaxID=353851 RepID=UPI001C898293|nr:hypothetical protein [Mycoplasma sp. Ms02]QZE12562.1 hypothetical protein K4L35_01050 [Mycoplasma sp. Ms02]